MAVPRLAEAAGFALDAPAIRAAVADTGATVVWLCSPNNPTALAEPDGTIAALLAALTDDAAAAGREPPVVVLDEAYAEFVGTSLVGLRDGYPNLIVVRTASKAYALAGLRIGFAVARPEMIARLNPYRPPGSISTVSITVVTEALLDPTRPRREPRARRARTDAPERRAACDRLDGRAVGDELHPGRLRIAGAGRRGGRRAPAARPSSRGPSGPAIRSPTTCA